MCTLLTDLEAVINARPLTSKTRLGRRSISFLSINPVRLNLWPTNHSESQQSALRDHKHVQFLNEEIQTSSAFASQSTRRWRNEYLTSLREQFAKGSSGRDVNAKFKVGDFWKSAKLEELLTGRDGTVRAAIVTVPRGTGSSLRLPIQHLIPTEVKP